MVPKARATNDLGTQAERIHHVRSALNSPFVLTCRPCERARLKSPYGKIGPWIASILPWRRDSCYVEPFAGMLGVLLCRRPVQPEIVNNRDGNLVCWWRMVRDHPNKFAHLVIQTPRSRDLYREACSRLKAGIASPARRALALHTQVRRLDRGVDKLSPELRDLAADA